MRQKQYMDSRGPEGQLVAETEEVPTVCVFSFFLGILITTSSTLESDEAMRPAGMYVISDARRMRSGGICLSGSLFLYLSSEWGEAPGDSEAT